MADQQVRGYGLFILEARVRECPVLAFDVPYGPAEQIDSGVDGVLVPAGDTEALARATLDLLADRDRLEAMRAPARAGALAHGHEAFLAAWARVAAAAWDRKPSRVRLAGVSVRVSGRTAVVRVDADRVPHDAVLRWQSWRDGDAAPTDLTTAVRHAGSVLTITADPAPEGTRERLLLAWHNASWQQELPPRRRWRGWPRGGRSGR